MVVQTEPKLTAEVISPLEQVKYKHGRNPNSLKALGEHRRTWPKGQSGLPTGISLTAALKEALRTNDGEKRRKLIDSTLAGAILREPTPFKEVWDRVEGKVAEKGPPVNNDNRVLNIIVINQHTADLIGRVGERAKKLIVGEVDAIRI